MTDISPEPLNDRRSAHRHGTALPITIRKRGSHQMPATLLDLSCEGCKVEGVRARLDESTYQVRIPGLSSRAAEVCWSSENAVGLRFAQPLHPAVATHVLEPQSSSSSLQGGEQACGSEGGRAQMCASRREQIMAGFAAPTHSILQTKSPAERGKPLSSYVRRNTKRVVDHRGEPRFPAPAEAENGFLLNNQPVRVADLSSSGLMVHATMPHEIGEMVDARFAGYETMRARIIWKRDNGVGLALPPNAIDLTMND